MSQLLRVRRRPSPAMVVAITALVLAASGTAVAATKLASGDSLIKKNSLSGNRLKNRSVAGSKIKLSSIGTVPRAAHAASANSATDATNATTAGSAAIAKLTYATAKFTVPGDETPTTGSVSCPAGTNVTGGGTSIDDTTDSTLIATYPNGKAGWSAVYQDFNGSQATGTVSAICAPAAATAP